HIGLPGATSINPSRKSARSRLAPLLKLNRLKNVGVKISGLYAVCSSGRGYFTAARPYIQEVYAAFGPRRLYWGSDFSPVLAFVSYSQSIDAVTDIGWPESDLSAIMHGNLTKLISTVENFT